MVSIMCPYLGPMKNVAWDYYEMIIATNKFYTIVSVVKEGRVVWYNLIRILIINTPINNDHDFSVLIGFVLDIKDTTLTYIQLLQPKIFYDITIVFNVMLILIRIAPQNTSETSKNSVIDKQWKVRGY